MNYTIIEGSCEDLSYIKEGTIDLVITSPPYYIVKDYQKNVELCIGQEKSFYTYLDRMYNVFKEWYRVLKVGKYCIINIGDIIVDYHKFPIFAYYVLLMQKIGFFYQEDIIWKKPEGMKTSIASKRFGIMMQNPYPRYYYPNNIYEHCLVFRKGIKPTYPIRKDENKVNIKNILQTYDSDVWEINPVQATQLKHEAPFPEELVRRFLELYTVSGELVLEPFFGSGTTMKVARDMRRNCIGYEINTEYIKFGKERVGWNQRTLFGETRYLHLRGKKTYENNNQKITHQNIMDNIIKEVSESGFNEFSKAISEEKEEEKNPEQETINGIKSENKDSG